MLHITRRKRDAQRASYWMERVINVVSPLAKRFKMESSVSLLVKETGEKPSTSGEIDAPGFESDGRSRESRDQRDLERRIENLNKLKNEASQ